MTIVLHLCLSIRALACFVAHGTGLVAQQDDRLCKGSDLGGVAMNGGGLAGRNGGRYPKHGSKRDKGGPHHEVCEIVFLRVLFTAIQIHSMKRYDTILESNCSRDTSESYLPGVSDLAFAPYEKAVLAWTYC